MPKDKSPAYQQYLIILVASLGYFVDIYDLILFNVVKKASMTDLGFAPDSFKEIEVALFNWQMGGMLAGGLLWGIMGDKIGRLKVLFGSILLYSMANIANAWVWDFPSYAAVRFIAGFGLAGELGAGITLISEIMHKEKRGYGTMIVVSFGALGAVLAATLGQHFSWKTCYYVGGIMGFLLLLLRVGALESGMFRQARETAVKRGNFFSLINHGPRFRKYLACIAMGLPVWYVVGVLINLSASYFAPLFRFSSPIDTGQAVMYCYIGLSIGDFTAGLFSQIFRTRLRVVLGYLLFAAGVIGYYFYSAPGQSPTYFYVFCILLGIATGYWALFVTIASEQFGTNIRSTVTNTVPNFVRGAVIPITYSFKELAKIPSIGVVNSAIIVGAVCIGLATLATLSLKDTFGKDLDYHEV